jgi:hypothetical protein
MYLSEICKIINAGPPSATFAITGVYVNMENYSHLTCILQMGVGAAATITVEKDADGSGAGTAIAFSYRLCDTAYNATGGDTLADDVLIVGAGGFAMGATDNSFAVIELDTDKLGADYPYVRVVATTGGAGLGNFIYILSGARYKEPATALTV